MIVAVDVADEGIGNFIALCTKSSFDKMSPEGGAQTSGGNIKNSDLFQLLTFPERAVGAVVRRSSGGRMSVKVWKCEIL